MAAGGEPDVVLACCGDVPTLETLAAADLLRQHLPDLAVRVVNVVDLMRLQPESEHPHGLSDADFDALFTTDKQVVFAWHGYPSLIHQLTYRRTNHRNIHVRGYKEEGTTTTPFDMVMLNDLDRFHLVMDVIDRVPALGAAAADVRAEMVARRARGPRPHPGRSATTSRRCATGPGRTEPGADPVRVLVVNAGSSSLKLRLVDADDRVAGRVDLPGRRRGVRGRHRRRAAPSSARSTPSATGSCTGASGSASRWWSTPTVRRALDELTDLAPLHQPKSLAALDAVTAAAPDVPAVACFDTAFHATLRPEAATYAVPAEWRRAVRRCGATGSTGCRTPTRPGGRPRSSPARATRPGAWSRATSGRGRRSPRSTTGLSVDTTMGFTPLEGLAMATRSGTVDPGALLWLRHAPRPRPRRGGRRAGAPVRPARPGRHGRHGRGGRARRRRATRRPGLALDVSTSTGCGPGICAMAASLGGLDVLVFTGGVGENAPAVRAAAAGALPFLGARGRPGGQRRGRTVDDGDPAGVCDITAPGAAARVLVVAAREDLEIARGVRALLT